MQITRSVIKSLYILIYIYKDSFAGERGNRSTTVDKLRSYIYRDSIYNDCDLRPIKA